jgi:hypothetical protein
VSDLNIADDAVAAVVNSVEEAWNDLGPGLAGKPMVPMLLSPLHKLRLFFCTSREEGTGAVSQAVTDGITSLTEQMMAEQVASAAKLQEEGAGICTGESAWPYNPDLPSLLLVNAACAARMEGDAVVVNSQTPVRDWFRVLNHELSLTNSPVRLLPLLTMEGTETSDPHYAAVEVPLEADYYTKHMELKVYGVQNQKDPGIQWQVLCDHTKLVVKQMCEVNEKVVVRQFVMSRDRSLRGVLLHNYTETYLSAFREKFGMRLLEEES